MSTLIWLFEWWLAFVAIILVIAAITLFLRALATDISNQLWRPRPREYGTEESRAAARAAAKPQRIIFWWL